MTNNPCCGGEEIIEKLIKEKAECGCGCGDYKIPDGSKIDNPPKSKKEINSSLLKSLEEESKKLNVTSIGYAKIPEKVFKSDDDLKYPNAIVLTTPIGMDIINEVPSEHTQKLNDELYLKFGNVTYELSDMLRKEGFKTQVAHPGEGLIDLSTLGQDSGLGYFGKNGLLITPELGPRLKISAILTPIENLPFSEKNSHEWIKNYCKRCNKCIKGCPQEALIGNDDELAKANLIDEKCIGCSHGCTYCIESCPFFENGYDWVKEKQMKLETKLKEKGKL